MKWILLTCLFLSNYGLASEPITGEGKFISKEDDGHEFVKKQLIFEGIKDIVSKELDRLELNKESFWQKYNEKLDEKLTEIETNYKEIKKFDEITNPKAKESVLNRIRLKRLNYQRSFLGLDKLLNKFSIRKLSRSQRNPNYRYIKIEGVIDSSKLTKKYYDLVRGKRVSDYGSLYLNSRFKLDGVSFQDLEVDNENDLKKEISKNWIDWFLKNKPVNISTIQYLEGDKLEVYESNRNTNIEGFNNSLVLDIEFNIKKAKFDANLNEYTFIIKGFAFLKDVESNVIISSYKFSESEKKYIKSERINIGNLIANHMYQMAKPSFPKVNKNIKNMSPITDIREVKLTNFKNINQVYKLLKSVETSGVKFSVKSKVESFSQGTANAKIYFDGDFENLKGLFEQIQQAKKDLVFDLVDGQDHIGIKFKKVVDNI